MRFLSVLMCLTLAAFVSLGSATHAMPQAASDTRAAAAAPVNLNSATVEQLQKLPGIGPKTAARIVEYRQKNGGFKKVEELMNVRGVGEKSFLKLKAQITVAAKPERP
jgi:competence protein ComEA